MNLKWNYTNQLVNDLIKINKAKEIVDLLELPISIEEEIKRDSLAKRVHFRRVPEISFVLDDSYFKQEKFEELLAKDKKEITSIEELEKKLK